MHGDGGQVFVSTHSPEFINGASLEEIYWLEKKNGYATVQRAADRDLLRRLIEEVRSSWGTLETGSVRRSGSTLSRLVFLLKRILHGSPA